MSGKNYKKISIIVPIYNAEDTIMTLLDSLERQECGLTDENVEHIFVDNGSSDSTIRHLRNYKGCLRLKVLIENQRRGPSAARNTGIRHCSGDIIVFIDSDCVASDSWLRNLLSGFKNENIGCVAGEIELQPSESKVGKFLRRIRFMSQKHTLRNYFLPYPQTANAAYRKKVFERIGLFDETI